MVSDKHANFLINTGDATAADLEGLGEEVRRRRPRDVRHRARMGDPAHRASACRQRADRRRSRKAMSKHIAVADGRLVARARGLAVERPRMRQGARRSRLPGHRDRRRPRPAGTVARRSTRARTRLQRAARARRRGRHDPGRARDAARSPTPIRGFSPRPSPCTSPPQKCCFAAAGLPVAEDGRRRRRGTGPVQTRCRRLLSSSRQPGFERRRAHRPGRRQFLARRGRWAGASGGRSWSSASFPGAS